MGPLPVPWPRLVTTDEVGSLLTALTEAPDRDVPGVLAAASWSSSAAAARRAMETAPAVARRLAETQWSVFASLTSLDGDRLQEARRLLGRTRDLLAHDELAAPLVPGLAQLEREAVQLITAVPPPPQPPVSRSTSGRSAPTGSSRSSRRCASKSAKDDSA